MISLDIMRPPKIREDCKDLYSTGDYSLGMLGDIYQVTRQAIKKHLNNRGINTDKKNGRKMIECPSCGDMFERLRCQRRDTVNSYCSRPCYYKAINNPNYFYQRHGMRIARKTVEGLGIMLREGYIVHHVDGDNRSNDPSNLMVFRSQSDHMKWHRLGPENSGVTPIWTGP